jgi:folylpolyglutamate synthase/dihydropteroate synthase
LTIKNITDKLNRIIIVTGHYGSGKTEFSVSLAMKCVEQMQFAQAQSIAQAQTQFALCDLDVVNPYFRSREMRKTLEAAGIGVYGSVFKEEITAELPALSASIRAPLENTACKVIIDTGGNDTGALVLNQFLKYFTDKEISVLAVINTNRPDTSDINGALEHIIAIEDITKLKITGIVNNTHMLRETKPDDIIKGEMICKEICEKTGKFLLCNCYPEKIVDPEKVIDPKELTKLENLMPLGLYMRPTWLDR